MVYRPQCYRARITQISELFDPFEYRFLNLPFYNIIVFFLYCPKLKKICNRKVPKNLAVPSTSICSLSCKTIYSKLLDLEDLPPPTYEKKLLACGVEKNDLNKVYL